VLGENIVPEFLQADCTPGNLVRALQPLLGDTPERTRQLEAFGKLDAIMAIGKTSPGISAADIVLATMRKGRR
jgi:lipid-A-disaccharide synthase